MATIIRIDATPKIANEDVKGLVTGYVLGMPQVLLVAALAALQLPFRQQVQFLLSQERVQPIFVGSRTARFLVVTVYKNIVITAKSGDTRNITLFH